MEEIAMADGSGLPPNFPPQAEPEQSRKSEISQLVGDDQLLSSSSPESSTPPSYSACFAAHHLQQHSASGSAVSALQSKVKALSERRAAGKDRDDKGPVVMSAGPAKPQAMKKGHEKKAPSAATGAPATGKWQTSSSDEEADAHVQEQLYQTDRPLPGDREELGVVVEGEGREASPPSAAMPRGLGEGASLENLSGGGDSFQEALSTKPWAPPEGFWKAARPETLLLNGDAQPKEETGQSGPGAGPGVQWKAGGEFVWRELQRSDSLESHLHRRVRKEVDLAGPLGGLWRADSLESVCSSRSALSLAERVEMNRTILKEMLGAPRCKDAEVSMLDAEQRTEEMSMCNGKALAALTDGDWDSGISLQDSEHCQRAFVFSDDLPLSPRHEQAKRLLERARMKARSYPLKADHTILPAQRDNPEPLSRGGIPLRRPLTGKEGAAASGNQSDSSGSDSVSGPRRRHGQSPTRVRFEDESEKDAEVRYLERLRQRRRAGEKAQGLLVSKPNLSSYVNGKKEGVVPTDRGRSPESILRSRRNQEDGPANKAALQEVLYKKCGSCGTFLEGAPVYHINPNQSSDGMALPCWVAPVHPSCTVRTERIKETYIGEVAPTEDLVSKCTHCGSACSAESGTGSVAYSPYLQKVAGGDIHAVLVSQENSRPRPCGPDVNATSGAVVLLPSPYASEQSGPNATAVKPCTCPASLLADGTPKDIPTAPKPKKSALKSASSNRPSGQRVVKLMPSPHYHLIDLDSLDTPCSSEPDLQHGASQEPGSDAEEQLCATLGYGEENPAPSSTGPAPCIRPSALKFSDHAALDLWDAAPEAPGRSHQGNGNLCHDPAGASPAARCAGDGRVRGPLRAEHWREDIPDVVHGFDSHRRVHAEGLDHREGRSKLSLRRFFSAFGLNSVGMLGKGRSSSMEHLSYSPRHSSASPSPTHRHGGQLKKAPSLQSLRMGSPFSQMRKASSVQSLQSPKKKGDRSSAYLLGEQQYNSASSRGLQRALSVEDVGCPSRVRSVGRVAQAFPDGTLLLELSRPSHGPFGFLIARGKGRPDSGVYVEEMGDSSTQKLYAGLLGIGDEILEVNGEKVAGLSLDQVTRLMTEYSTASIRVLRHRRPLR